MSTLSSAKFRASPSMRSMAAPPSPSSILIPATNIYHIVHHFPREITSDFGIERDADAALPVVGDHRDFACAPGAVTVRLLDRVTGTGVGVTIVQIITDFGVLD